MVPLTGRRTAEVDEVERGGPFPYPVPQSAIDECLLHLERCRVGGLNAQAEIIAARAPVTHALFLAVPPKRTLRFRRCLGNGGGVSYEVTL